MFLSTNKPKARKSGIHRMTFGTAYVLGPFQVYVPKSDPEVTRILSDQILKSKVEEVR